MATSEKRTLEIRAKLVDLLTKPLGGMEGALARWSKRALGSFQNLLRPVFNLKTALAGLAASFLSLSTVKAFGEQADALLKLAASTGDVVENISELEAAFSLAGVKAESFGGILRALLARSREAQDGNLEIVDSFQAIGISIDDLGRLGPSQLFEKMAAGLEQFGTAQQRASALGKVLPRQFLELLPILGGGLEKFQAAIVEARKFGATVSRGQAEASDRLDNSLSSVQLAIGGVSRALIQEFGPKAIALFQTLAKSITENREGIVSFAAEIGRGIVQAVGLALDAIVGLISAIEKIPGVKLVNTDELDAQIAELERRRLNVRRNFAALGDAMSEASIRAQKPILEELNKLLRKREEGLAGALTDLREKLRTQLEEIAADVRGAAPVVAADVAPAFGLPKIESWEDYAREFGRAMQQMHAARAEAFGAAASAPDAPGAPPARPQWTSALRETSGTALGDPESPRESSLEILQKQTAQVQQLAGLAPGVESLNERLREMQAQAFTLELREARDKGLITIEQMTEAQKAFNEELARTRGQLGTGDFFAAFDEQVTAAAAGWTDFAAAGREAANTVVVGGLDGITNALADGIMGTKSFKEAFKDFARSMLADIARITIRLAIMNSLAGAFGGGTGGIALEKGGVVQGDMGTPVRAFARGGITNGPTLALFGEGNRREAFVPLPDNRSIPVTLRDEGGSRGGGQPVNVFFNTSFIDARDGQRFLKENERLIVGLVQQALETRVGVRQSFTKAVR